MYDPTYQPRWDGITHPNSNLGISSVIDGTSNTLLAAEVHAWTAYTRNSGPAVTTTPASVAAVLTAVASGRPDRLLPEGLGTGHTEWPMALPSQRIHHHIDANTVVPYLFNGLTYNSDFNSQQEGSSSCDRATQC